MMTPATRIHVSSFPRAVRAVPESGIAAFVPGRGAACMACNTPGIGRFAMMVVSRNETRAVDGRFAGTAGMQIAAAGGVMVIFRSRCAGAKDREACRDGKKGKHIFHDREDVVAGAPPLWAA